MPKKSASIVEQVHNLAWAGKHQKAIELATQELETPNLPVSLRMDLLYLRADAFQSLGRMEEAVRDAKSMKSLANQSRTSMAENFHKFSAMAYNSQARNYIIYGDFKKTFNLFQKALKHAELAGEKDLICSCLVRFSGIANLIGKNELAIRLSQKGLELAQEIGDLEMQSHAKINLFSAFNQMGQRRYEIITDALNLALKSGSLQVIGSAYNILGTNSQDAALSIKYIKKSIEAHKAWGSIVDVLTTEANLAYIYTQLGLLFFSRRLFSQLLADLPYKDLYFETIVLSNLVTIEVETKSLEQARFYLNRFSETAPLLNSEHLNSYLFSAYGNVSFLAGEYSQAVQHYSKALNLARTNKFYRENEMLTELGKVYLAQRDFAQALASTTEAVKIHEEASFAQPENSSCPNQRIWWLHTQALHANHKTAEMRIALERAYDFLLESIANVPDVGLRRNYLNKVTGNRDLLRFWLSEGKREKLSKERLFAYLNIKSNTREPFTRLTDTSQRLNLLKDIPAIQTFLVEEAIELSGAERLMLILEDGKKLEVAESILPVGEEADKVFSSIKKHLTQARLTRTVQLVLPKKQGLSRIIAPLIAQNQVVGYLYADMDSIYGLFDETDRDMLGMLANQAAVALDNAGLVTNLEQKVNERTAQLQASITETQRLLKESRTLGRVGRDISSSLDLEQVLENITSYAKDLLNADLSALLLPEQGGSTFRAVTALGIYANDLLNDVVSLGDGLLGSVAKNKIGEIINDTHLDSRSIAISGTELIEHEHLLAVPLLEDNELRGLMAVWRSGAGREFNQNELNFLINLSRQAVVALKNAQLFSEAHESRLVAEQANKMKSAFLANMSHELRTPLNAIINFTELVQMGVMGEVNEEQKEALGYSLGSSKHLLQLINDVLDISKIQAGKLTLFLDQKVDLSNEIEDVLHMVEPLLKKQIELYEYDVKLVKDVDANLPLITCDRRRIRQVLLNLLSNAVKFTQKGSITLSVKRKADHLEFAVIDTGTGIRQDMQTQIFEPFQQTEDGIKQVEGTGLGLPITKSLVEAHGGRIWLESEPGEGSAFFFILPTR